MAYNNNFPVTYQPYQGYPQFPQSYPQNQQIPQMQPQQQNNSNMVWVSGEAGAKAYLIAPNTTVQLWDSEQNVVYIKSADASGMPTMKILDYTIREQGQPKNTLESPKTDFVTHDELKLLEDSIKGELKAIKEEMGA